MKQKTFQFDDELARSFEKFCHQQFLIEKQVASAAILHFMKMDANLREEAITAFSAWCEQFSAKKTRPEARAAGETR